MRGRRLIGRWCFLDRYGPLSFTDEKPMDVATHPHIGIQTVSWLIEGEVIHHESLGCEAVVRPGGVNLMNTLYYCAPGRSALDFRSANRRPFARSRRASVR